MEAMSTEAPPGTATLGAGPGVEGPVVTPPSAHAPAAQPRPPRDTMSNDRESRHPGHDIEPRLSALFRVVASPSTVLVGGDLALAWHHGGIGIAGFGTERSIAIGSATVLAFAAAPWLDVVELLPGVSSRVGAEVGIAIATATAMPAAHATPANAFHLALDAGLAGAFDFGAGWTFDGFVGVGYASSLTVTADGRDIASLGGLFVTTTLGVRIPLLR
jgi:hypothetical protein